MKNTSPTAKHGGGHCSLGCLAAGGMGSIAPVEERMGHTKCYEMLESDVRKAKSNK